MTELIDLSLVRASRELLEAMLERRGLSFFLSTGGGQPLFSLEKSKVDLVVKTAASKLAREGRNVHPKAVEHSRKEIRRALIREVTTQMMRVGY